MVRKIITLLVFLVLPFRFSGNGFSQELPVKHIPEVTVTLGNEAYFSDDQTTQEVESDILRLNRHKNLGYVLERHTPAMMRTYGANGALVSVSLHGTGSNHTQVNWNGFPLNSPTTGQADLALIPVGFMQSAEVINGASGALFGSGTFGGAINLGNRPDWNNRIAGQYSLEVGSFGSFSHLLTCRTGTEKLQIHISAITSRAENNFRYRDHYRSQSPEVMVEHNAYQSVGMISNVYLNLNKGNHLEAGFWYQHKDLEIPALMGSNKTSNARQKDSTFRSYLSYRKISQKYALAIKSAYFSDELHYTDKNSAADTNYTIDSRIATARLMNEADFRYYFSSKVIIGGGATFNRNIGNSGNYGGKITESEYGLFGSVKINVTNLIINAGLRKEFFQGFNPPLQYTFGVRYRANEHFVIRTGFSSKFRKPTFNEKYWHPGGNPGLQPEKGRGGEITLEYTSGKDMKRVLCLDVRTTLYLQWIDNWIQWVIRDSLTPVEYKKVRIYGFETGLDFGITSTAAGLKGSVIYNYNRSVIINTYDRNIFFEGNQLMYAPVHVLRAGLEGNIKGFTLGASSAYTGYRETVESADWSLRLPGYFVVDITTGFHRNIGNHQFTVDFLISNLLNKSYEVIRAYPMPGRSYHLSVSVGLEKLRPFH